MKIALIAVIVVLAYPAFAEVLHLPNHSADAIKAICAKQHGGVFYNHGNVFGCAMAKGTVQCDGAHCEAYPKARPRPRPQQPPQWQWQEQPWQQQQW
jgi:hypothetical protein